MVAEAISKPGSFEELALPLFDSLFNFAVWLTRNQAEAEDLVQETYTKALQGFASFQPGTNIRAWMFRILRNSFLTSRTGLAIKMTVPLEPEDEERIQPAVVENPESALLESADRQAIQEAIEELPLHYREVLLLCDVEEMSYQEISDALAIPLGTVMSRLSRARRMMRGTLMQKLRRS
jgi:RNA polymerase sigma-70 factor (ECF subfamily)